ncbi:alpha-mannosidase [Bacillus circulans]|uniref:alpha-mannosidase n=1 Tax=Niallia TaxID=2837506 RepID=UPI001490144B|nr:alpha-mannosidase [Niallia circulans]NRG27821.1 alpha-mannosidase [Niallia circulans]QJX63877.1 alpha-mannosidase [Niallia circulans]
MFWTEKKLDARIKELEKYRYRESISLDSFSMQLDEEGEIGARPPENGEWATIHVGDHWAGRDHYAWLKTEVAIPVSWKGKQVLGYFDFGITDGGTNSGFESLLYVNKKIYQGVDANHREVFLKEEHCGTNVSLIFRLWSGLEGGGKPFIQEHKIKKAEIAWLDEATDDLYYTAKAMIQTIHILDENRPEYQTILTALNRAFYEIDWTEPESDLFYESINKANNYLNAALEKMDKHAAVTIHAIGHTHIDVAWLWRLKHTREKAARSFSTVLRLMEKYPEYLFMQSQPQLYAYLKEDYPEIYAQLKDRVAEGRWEPEGGMWLEPDCNLPSGESFVRQLLNGTRFLKEEFGVTSKYLWLPDVFGYSWALPQILKQAGIETFMTTKISWNQYNRMPHDTFQWRGIDGTEILTHFVTTPYPNSRGWAYDYNGEMQADVVQGAWDNYKDKNITQDLLMSYGYGDGGGGVNRDMLEMRRRFDRIPGLPAVKSTKAGDYFDALHEKVKTTDEYVHTWDGELYLEFHRGTYTSQAYNKRSNRKQELLYRETELLSVLVGVLASDWTIYPQEELHKGWTILLRNQFHDIIPGSSIREVYEDSLLEYEEAEGLANKAQKQVLTRIIDSDVSDQFTVINDSSWIRSGLVEVPVKLGLEEGEWSSENGKVLQVEKVNGKWLILVEDVPSHGLANLLFKSSENQGANKQSPFVINNNGIETPFYQILWNEKGQLTRIFDKKAQRNVLKENQAGNVLQVFEDKPLRWEAWDIDIFYQEKHQEISTLEKIEIIENNSLRAVIKFVWTYHHSKVEQEVILYAENPRIDFKTSVDWHEQHQLLKVAFPVEIRSTQATYDIQFGNVQRPTHWNTSWDYAKFETVGHQWADLSEQGYGISLLNDCKYGYDIKDSVMRLSLIKAGTYPDYLQDQGAHTFIYSLLPHQGDWREGRTVQEAWDLNQPLKSLVGKLQSQDFSLFQIASDHCFIDAVKKAEDEDKVIVRLHEFMGKRGTVELTSDAPIKGWQECNLLEGKNGEKQENEIITFAIKPYEVKTFLVEI